MLFISFQISCSCAKTCEMQCCLRNQQASPFVFCNNSSFFPAVISPLAAGTRKPWISSPPVRWRCLNAAHALIETRFRLSDNAQSIFCRHRVILEPPNLNNFFDRIDVQLGQLVSSFALFIFLELANL